MRHRRIAALAVLAVLAGTHSASAVVKKKPLPKPLCRLVVDPSGDVKTADPSIDLISADIASNKDMLTVVFRVAKLAASDSMARIEGRRNTIILYYRHTVLQRWIEEALSKAGVTILTGAMLQRVDFLLPVLLRQLDHHAVIENQVPAPLRHQFVIGQACGHGAV